jgi:hypothetical protein
MLDQEIEYHDRMRPEWLNTLRGRFVLVKDSALVGAFDNPDQAIAEGARQFGLSSFLVRRVEPHQEAIQIPAFTPGILRADSAHLNSR